MLFRSEPRGALADPVVGQLRLAPKHGGVMTAAREREGEGVLRAFSDADQVPLEGMIHGQADEEGDADIPHRQAGGDQGGDVRRPCRRECRHHQHEHGHAEQHDDHDQIAKNFNEAVNMAPAELERFLDSDDSKRVGWKGEDGKGDGESTDHAATGSGQERRSSSSSEKSRPWGSLL